MSSSLRIALIGSARHPIREPFAGGLESHTWMLARSLRRRGHDVTIFAGSGCDPALRVREMRADWPRISAAARADVSMTAETWLDEHHAYLSLMLALSRSAEFQVVHNNSLHHLPVAMAAAVPAPVVTTLHTPPTPWLESAVQLGPCPVTFVAVSEHTARAWRHALTAQVIPNGVDIERWPMGAGGGGAVWFGRLVPEKGPDFAIRAALLAGLTLDLIGPIGDQQFFDNEIAPHLGQQLRYLGHLDQAALGAHVGAASVALVTPRWDEPYGLVAAESLACGTPVAGFASGGLPEVVDEGSALLVERDDVAALADAATRAQRLCRADCRARAVTHCSADQMVERYETLYAELSAGWVQSRAARCA